MNKKIINPGSVLGILILGVTLVLSLFAAVRVSQFVATDLGLNLKDDTTGEVVMVVSWSIALLATYIVGNVLDGQKPTEVLKEVRGATFKLGLFALLLVFVGLLVWGGFSFVSSTPLWALVIIVLLVLILMK